MTNTQPLLYLETYNWKGVRYPQTSLKRRQGKIKQTNNQKAHHQNQQNRFWERSRTFNKHVLVFLPVADLLKMIKWCYKI